MKKNFGVQTILYPMPVLIIGSYDENGIPNAMNAAWGGIHNTNEVGICLSADHKTVKNILKSKAFTVSFADVEHIVACDYVGIASGNNVCDKMHKAGFSVSKSEFVNAPVINELSLSLDCELISYDEESEYMVGKIVNVAADESILTDGKIDVNKLQPVTYDPVSHNYVRLGDVVGKAFSDGKKLF